jgi:phycobilisome core-membrane linker protein
LGRAPYDQADIRKYNLILANEGLKGFITAMVNSEEYAQAFGEDVVPYNRYLTLPAANFPNTQRLYNTLTKQNRDLVVPSFEPVKPRMDAAKMPLTGKAIADIAAEARKQDANRSELVELGRSFAPAMGSAIEEGLEATRSKPARLYRMQPGMSLAETESVLNAIYVQVLDGPSGQIPLELRRADLESRLWNGAITVREFVRLLASSGIYVRRFYAPYPTAKVIEFLFRHLLGRAPATQAEIDQYTALLNNSGLQAVVDALVGSDEYTRYFGEEVVPYKRSPQLAA